MLDNIVSIINTILTGDQNLAIIGILMCVIVYLSWDRHRLIEELTKKDLKIDKIIDDYFKGNITLSDALNELKLVLYEIKGKLF